MFVTLEGIEGSGKSTQAARLVERLRAAGRRARLTREPGGSPLADATRALLLHPAEARRALAAAGLAPPMQGAADAANAEAEPLLPVAELFLLAAARAQHVARLRGWLAADEVVVSDRFADATRAYQGYGRGLDPAWIAAVERMATGGLRPDTTLLLDLPAEEGQRRKREATTRGGEWNRLDAEALAFHERVRAGYLVLAAAEPRRWVLLDATRPADALAADVWAAVAPRLSGA